MNISEQLDGAAFVTVQPLAEVKGGILKKKLHR
jgi:hypothetical protein